MDMHDTVIRNEILHSLIGLFNEKGLKFTMDDLAVRLHRSKKTIYACFPDKKQLLDDMVDYIFDAVQESKRQVLEEAAPDTVTQIRKLLSAMPEEYQNVDLRQLYILKEKYPEIYEHVKRRLESDWEPTVRLIRRGMREGVIRDFSIPVFRTMMESTLEQFFKRDVLIENGISYNQALQEVVDILVTGIMVK